MTKDEKRYGNSGRLLMFQTQNGWTKEKMIAHVKLEFKGKSVATDNVTCMYRGLGGKKCAMGMFIPDDKYDYTMERDSGNSARSVIEKFCLHDIMPLDTEGMEGLQSSHDRSSPISTLEDMINWINENVADV